MGVGDGGCWSVVMGPKYRKFLILILPLRVSCIFAICQPTIMVVFRYRLLRLRAIVGRVCSCCLPFMVRLQTRIVSQHTS